jgi:16S rRNA (cytosine967-C5)-methyltransferase
VLAPGPRERIADLCAAPGGKTAQLASAGAHVIAVEQNVGRLARLRENIGRLRLDVEIVNADAVHWRPADPLDAVLLDAPCSATGTIRRHPDVPYLKRPRDIAALVALQDELIAAACAMLRPGGRMVFAVCSLLPEEGSARIAHALARLPLRLDPIFLPALPEAVTPDGCLRTTPAFWPERGGMDGFFAARLIRD